MKQDTVIKLIKLTLKNFEETNDVEHLNDIIQIIFEYKKSQQGWVADSTIISFLYYNTKNESRGIEHGKNRKICSIS